MREAVVVIDVLRAFSTAAYAAAAGVPLILLADSLATASRLRNEVPDAVTLTDGRRRDGVDLVNSPAVIARASLAGRTLIMTTTNGTPAALAVGDGAVLLCASFVNAQATVDYLRSMGIDSVRYVASGGPDADEDVACAHYLDALRTDPTTDPAPYLARVAASTARAALDCRVAKQDSGVDPDDVDFCLRVNAVPIALVGAPARDVAMLVPHHIAAA